MLILGGMMRQYTAIQGQKPVSLFESRGILGCALLVVMKDYRFVLSSNSCYFVSMKSAKYEFVEHTADMAVRVYGDSLDRLMVHAAEALFEVIGPPEDTPKEVRLEVKLEADNLEHLFHDWLAELNYLHLTRHEIYHTFEIHRVDERRLEATIAGQPISSSASPVELEIKAVTYHQLEVKKTDLGWEAFVIFDI